MNYAYSRTYCKKGDLFGLSSTDLTCEQLNKLSMSKLAEFVDKDPIAERIMADRLAASNIDQLYHLTEVENPHTLGYLKETYNVILDDKREEIELACKRYSYGTGRERYYNWDLLNDYNKLTEIRRLADGEISIANYRRIDYDWLFKNNKLICDSLIDRLITRSSNELNHVIPRLPETCLLRHIEDIVNKTSLKNWVTILSNPYTPEKYKVKAFKAIAGKKRVMSGLKNVTLSKKVLKQIPPVTRLSLLESVMDNLRYNNLSFGDIKTTEDLESLLFCVSMKKNVRVKKVIDIFNRSYRVSDNQ